MGNGAGANASSPLARYGISSLAVLEKLCRSGHFQSNYGEYQALCETAIDKQALDVLEILIPAGNARRLKPLHIAAAKARLDSVDLLVSAGFSCSSTNEDGRTPLHLTAFTNSFESSLCATLLIYQELKALRVLDCTGMAPIHLAALESNRPVIGAIINSGGDTDVLSKTGQTAYELALDHNDKEMARFLKSFDNKITQKSPEVKPSLETTLLIWERFFENAFARSEAINSYGDEDSLGNSCPLVDTSYKDLSYDYNPVDSYDSQVNDDWFNWIVCYDSATSSDDSYYALHKLTGETRWLAEHAEIIRKGLLYPTYWDNTDELMRRPYPSNINEIKFDGWLTYYDNQQNSCMWMSIPTKSFSYYLPLTNEDAYYLRELGIYASADDENWFEADQSCALSWVVVVINGTGNRDEEKSYRSGSENDIRVEGITTVWDAWEPAIRGDTTVRTDREPDGLSYREPDSESAGLYYLNRMTGGTTWTEPENWDTVKEQWNGWLMCCNEEDSEHFFWYDEATGESIWVDTQ